MTPSHAPAAPPASDDPVAAAAETIRRLAPDIRPALAIVGGSGLDLLAALGEPLGSLAYDAIPGLGAAGVAGHANRWILARVGAGSLYCLLGRRHLYEGIEPSLAGLAMRILARLGVRQVVLTNAAGGLGPALRTGDLMLIRDHLNLMFSAPQSSLRQSAIPNPQSSIPTPVSCLLTPDSSFSHSKGEGPVGLRDRIPHCYDPQLCAWLLEDALAEGIPLKEGVYAAVSGPPYETRAEAAMLRGMGADAAGMSTVPEVLAAAAAGMRVAALSLVTNSHWHRGGPASHAEVLAAAAASGDRLRRLLQRFAARFASC